MVPRSVSFRTDGRVSHVGSCARITSVDGWISCASRLHVSVVLMVPASDDTSWITHLVQRLWAEMFIGWMSWASSTWKISCLRVTPVSVLVVGPVSRVIRPPER